MVEPVSDEAAMGRWMVITAVRIGGVVMAVAALLINANRLPAPHWLSYPLLVVGLFGVFVAPVLLARKWASPKE